MPQKPVQSGQKQRIQIHLDESEANGHYANLILINHSPAEFVLDFARVVPASPKARVQTRVLLAPQHAKNLLNALGANIKKYEETFGEIKLAPKGEDVDKHFGFQA